MNSRGKPLTLFEHFKAELEHSLRQISGETANRIMKKIDIDWTDMLWRYRGEDNIIVTNSCDISGSSATSSAIRREELPRAKAMCVRPPGRVFFAGYRTRWIAYRKAGELV